jgi:hypothetical protein
MKQFSEVSRCVQHFVESFMVVSFGEFNHRGDIELNYFEILLNIYFPDYYATNGYPNIIYQEINDKFVLFFDFIEESTI